jgi:hypothetical protein
MKSSQLFLIGAAALLAAGCSNLFSFQETTSPSDTPAALSGGRWTSISSTPSAETCTSFTWTIVEISGTSGTGTFTATCFDGMEIAGTAQGTLVGTEVTWTAEATGTTSGGLTCPISLSGTATYDGSQFRIPYTGTTCLGPVSGVEILRKN